MKWFDVDKAGLAAILERKGKAFAVLELVQNAWDAAGVTEVKIEMVPIEGVPYAKLTVTDNSTEGWANLEDAYTMFSPSRRASNPLKRGRFCLGEKLVLACCRAATIETMQGAVHFDAAGGRRQTSACRERGTRFTAEIRMTREEASDVAVEVLRLIPPCTTRFNGSEIIPPDRIKVFGAKLPTEFSDETGVLRRTMRNTEVQIFDSCDLPGDVLEMGVPVCGIEIPWRVNVCQKIPLNMERDSVTEAFRKALTVAVVNEMAAHIPAERAADTWVQEAMGDSRAKPEAVKDLFVKRFGERAVVASPSDPMANATAAAQGVTVIHGGTLSAEAWANVRKFVQPTSAAAAFPSPKPEEQPERPKCAACKRPF